MRAIHTWVLGSTLLFAACGDNGPAIGDDAPGIDASTTNVDAEVAQHGVADLTVHDGAGELVAGEHVLFLGPDDAVIADTTRSRARTSTPSTRS